MNTGIVFYKTSRASDDIDFALEYLSLISFGDQGLNEGELPYNTELNVFKSDMFQDSSYDQEVINKRKPWMYERVIASIDLDSFSRKKLPGLAKNSSLGSSNLDILVSTFCNYMQKESTKNLAWTTGPVFTKNKKYPVQYGSEDVSFYRKNSYQVGLHFRLGWEMQEYSINQLEIFPAIILGRIFERYIDIISYNTLEENQRNDWAKQREDAIAAGANLLELEQEDPLSHKLLFYKNLLDVNNLCFKFNLLKSSFSEESITLFKEHFGDRSVEGQAFSYSDTTISASINLEQDRETVHSDSDLHPQGVIKLNNADFEFIKSFITDYVTNECDGDWESVSDSFYNCFSLYFKMPSDVWIDFQTLAKELTNSELNEEFDEFEVAEYQDQANFLRVPLPNLQFIATQSAKINHSKQFIYKKWDYQILLSYKSEIKTRCEKIEVLSKLSPIIPNTNFEWGKERLIQRQVRIKNTTKISNYYNFEKLRELSPLWDMYKDGSRIL